MRQPVAVAIDAIHGGFRGYHRGVLGGKCGDKIDHVSARYRGDRRLCFCAGAAVG
jgi:hypothetical protein